MARWLALPFLIFLSLVVLLTTGCFLDSKVYLLNSSVSNSAETGTPAVDDGPLVRSPSFMLGAGVEARDSLGTVGVVVTGLSSTDQIKLYTDASCATAAVGTFISAGAGTEVVTVSLTANQDYQFYYQIMDAFGRATACAPTTVQYAKVRGYTVTTTATPNTTDSNLADGICNQGTGQCTLRAAIAQAINVGEEVIIDIPAGTYTLTSTILMTGASILKPVTLRGATGTILSGGNTQRIFDVSGTMPTDGALTIKKITFQNGFANGDSGGAINIMPFNGNLVIESCEFKNNLASQRGGALYIWGTGVTVKKTKFENNSVSNNGLYGLAIYVVNSVLVLFDEIEVKNHNTNPTFVNGVITLEYSAGVTIANSSIFNNAHTEDIIDFFTCDQCELKNTTVVNNGGRGVDVTIDTGEMFLISNVTIADNSSAYPNDLSRNLRVGHGGGYFLFTNSIAYLSSGTGANADIQGSGTRNINNNIINDNAHGLLSGVTNVNPQLMALADNGGFTLTMLLGNSSPARDTGHNASCLTTDQRGLSRPRDGGSGTATCDIGAVEM